DHLHEHMAPPRSDPVRGRLRIITPARSERNRRSGVSAGGDATRVGGMVQPAPLVLGGPAPHAGVLVGGQREVEALAAHVAAAADPAGRLDLLVGDGPVAGGEEEVGVGVATSGAVTPLADVPGMGGDPGQSHWATRM